MAVHYIAHIPVPVPISRIRYQGISEVEGVVKPKPREANLGIITNWSCIQLVS